MTNPDHEPTSPRVLLSAEEAAQRMNVGRTTVYALLKTGELESVKVGRLRRVPADSVDAYITTLIARGTDPDGCTTPATGSGNATTPATTKTTTDQPKSGQVAGSAKTRPDLENPFLAPLQVPQGATATATSASEDQSDEKMSAPKPKRRRNRPEGTRAPNGASSIYKGGDGKWHGRVTMGVRDDGKPDRRHVERKTEAEVIKTVKELEKERDSGTPRKAGRPMTVAQWLTHWVENIAEPTVRYKTITTYRTVVYKHLIPGIGSHRLDRIEPEHFEKLYRKLIASGLKPVSVHQVHRVARTAFMEALRRKRIGYNPVALAKPPRVEDEEELEAYSKDEIVRLVTTALKHRNGVRYVLALAMGTRQGETLGFKWSRLNRKTRTLKVRRGLQFQTWQHGCEDPHACGARLHKVEPCKPGCGLKRHAKKCPPPCKPDCVKHASSCPERHSGGLVEVDVKSKAGKRDVVLPDPLYDLLMMHETAQTRERETAGSLWEEGDWMFCQSNGRPIGASADWSEWKSLLDEAGVRDEKLHLARHTAATVLALLRVAPRVAMDFMGWSDPAMLIRYQHVTGEMRKSVADDISGFFWAPEEAAKEGEPEDSEDEN